VTPLTDPAVPTGMNAGVCTAPCGVVSTPLRPCPPVMLISKRNTSRMLWNRPKFRNPAEARAE